MKNKLYLINAVIALLMSVVPLASGGDLGSCSPENKEEEKSLEPKGSRGNPIVFEGVKDFKKLRSLQDEYLQKNYPDYKIRVDSTSMNRQERSIRCLWLIKDDEIVKVYFDEQDATVELRKKNAVRDKAFASKLLRKYHSNQEAPLGTTFKRAVPVKNVKTREEIDQQEKDFLNKNYPDYQIESKVIWFVENKFLERIKIKNGDKKETINFNISDYMREYKKRNKIKLKELYPTAYLVEMP